MKIVCPNCKKDKIQGKAWVQLNNTKIVDFSPLESGDREDYWCPICEIHILPIELNRIIKN